MKLTKKQIDIIREQTPQELKGVAKCIESDFGYYRPSNANWSYYAGFINYNGQPLLIVTRFGHVM